MTTAERQQRLRDREKQDGARSFMLKLRGDKLKLVEMIAAGMEVSQARALTMIVDLGLGEMWFAVREMQEMIDKGATCEEASKPIVHALTQRLEGGAAAG